MRSDAPGKATRVKLTVLAACSNTKARAGTFQTGHGPVETPVFMPVGTQGTVKAVAPRELKEIGSQIILSNTYHLALRPGADHLRSMGGLHRFMQWDRPILTDSGGYQVYSLSQLRRIDPDGVTFQSHIDGSYHRFTPESVIDVQRAIGSDIMMILDECPEADCGFEYARRSNEITIQWAKRAADHLRVTGPNYGHAQAAFGIVQGNVYPELRRGSAQALMDIGFDGYAIGGLAVGEPPDVMYDVTDVVTDLLPADQPRYLMGVGTPRNIVESIARGVDMFDCVMPTRNGRNAMVFTREGPLSIKKERFAADEQPLDAGCGCYACATFSRAYLHHLFRAREILALHLASLHNLAFYHQLVKEARSAILIDRFGAWKNDFLARYAGP
jgi:queuine tRNA-ribosyltransferase